MQFIDPKGSFLKNLVLSVLLLGVGSLVIPVVLKQIDDRKFADQQRFQAELSRQDKIIDAQAELLDTLAADFWNYELYASDVLYSHDARFGRDDWHQRAVDAYYTQSGPLLWADAGRHQQVVAAGPGTDLRRISAAVRRGDIAAGFLPARIDEKRGYFLGYPHCGYPNWRRAAGTLPGEQGKVRRGIVGHADGLC